MESTEDLLNLLEGYGLGSAADWFDKAEETAKTRAKLQLVRLLNL